MMDMRRLLAYTNHIVPSLLALAVCLFSGCEKSATQKVTDDLGNAFISFSGGTSEDYAVKSEDGSTPVLATTATLKDKDKPFGVFGGKSYDGITNFSSVFQTDRAQKVYWEKTLNNNEGAWTYDDPKQKWERAMHYRFRAVWPYVESNVKANSSANLLSVTYHSLNEDYDLMVAYATRYPLGDPEGVGQVALTFKHALAGLRFIVKYSDNAQNKEADAITEFYLTGIYSQGQLFYGYAKADSGPESMIWDLSEYTFNVDTPQFHWPNTNGVTAGKEIPFGGTGNEEVANVYFTKTNSGETYTLDGAALIVPQTLSSTRGDTYVHFRTKLGGKALHTVKLPTNTTLDAGKIYTFTLSINETTITIDGKVQDWKKIYSNIDIIL